MSLAAEQMGGASNFGLSGFFQLKGIDKSLTKPLVHNAETDWIEIRFAEVLMNYGECANEIGVQSEALDVLYKIRKRANINAGNGTYGVTATTQTDVREAYIKERFVEFAFENYRFWDVRRWKIGSKTQVDIFGIDIKKSEKGYDYSLKKNKRRVWNDKMNLYPIPQSELYKNTNLNPQNVGW
jgi:hypothetical protein